MAMISDWTCKEKDKIGYKGSFLKLKVKICKASGYTHTARFLV
jgi:hypothetical protein